MRVKNSRAAERRGKSEIGAQRSIAMKIMTVNAVLVLMIFSLPAFSLVCEGFIHRSGATNGIVILLRQDGKVAFTLLKRVHSVQFGRKRRLARANNSVDTAGKSLQASSVGRFKWHFRKVLYADNLSRSLEAASAGDCHAVGIATRSRWTVQRRMEPPDVPTRKRKSFTIRPVKLFVLCSSDGLEKLKKTGITVSPVSRAPPGHRDAILSGNHHRRALKGVILPPLISALAPGLAPSPNPYSPKRKQYPPFPPFPPIPPLAPFPPASPLPTPKPPPKVPIPPLPLNYPHPKLTIPPLPPVSTAGLPPSPLVLKIPLLPLPYLTPTPPLTSLLPPMPVTLPTSPLLPVPLLPIPPLPITLPPILPNPLALPPLPIQISSLPCVPSSSVNSLPPP